jgi:hypothetical protein
MASGRYTMLMRTCQWVRDKSLSLTLAQQVLAHTQTSPGEAALTEANLDVLSWHLAS